MANPTRFPSGLSTAARQSTLFNLPFPDPTKVFTYFDDFTDYQNTTGGVSDMPYVDTFITAGSPTIAAVASEPFGAILVTNTASDNDGAQIQYHVANFTLGSGKKAWFKARFKVSDATQSDWAVGLVVLDTTVLGATDGAGVTDGIFFSKDDGDTQIDIQAQKTATAGQTRQANIGTCTTSYMTLGFEFDGVRYVTCFMDDVKVYTLDLSTTLTTYLPDAALSPTFALLNGEAVAKTMTIDYVFAAIER